MQKIEILQNLKIIANQEIAESREFASFITLLREVSVDAQKVDCMDSDVVKRADVLLIELQKHLEKYSSFCNDLDSLPELVDDNTLKVINERFGKIHSQHSEVLCWCDDLLKPYKIQDP